MYTCTVNGVAVRRFVYPYINANMYFIVDNGRAIVIDPHQSDELHALLTLQDINDILILLTHEHPDHTSGVNWVRTFANSTVICQDCCAKSIAIEKNNRPVLLSFILAEQDRINNTNTADEFNKIFPQYVCAADITFSQEYIHQWQGRTIKFLSTPGHSKGSAVIIFDEMMIFTGDSLLKKIPAITRFPGGSTKDYNNITLPFLKSLDEDMLCFPGHGDEGTLKEILHDF